MDYRGYAGGAGVSGTGHAETEGGGGFTGAGVGGGLGGQRRNTGGAGGPTGMTSGTGRQPPVPPRPNRPPEIHQGLPSSGGGHHQSGAGGMGGHGGGHHHPENADNSSQNHPPAGKGGPMTSANFVELFRRHWHATIAYCSVFWSFGMCVAFLGPTLLDLGCVTGSDMKTISWVFFSQLLCSLIGSIAAGYLAQRSTLGPPFSWLGIEKVDSNLVLLVATSLIPAAMFVVSFCKVLAGLGIVLAIMGLNMGCIDCLANLQMIQLYGPKVSPFLQAMHFCYGVGAFVSPMIAEPFLLNEDCTPMIDNMTGQPPLPGEIFDNSSQPASTLQEAQAMTKVHYAFWIMCALQIPIPFIVGTLFFKMRGRGLRSDHTQLINSDSAYSLASQKGNVTGKSDYENIDKQKESAPFWSSSQSYPQSRLTQCCGSSTSQVMSITALTAGVLFIYDGLQSAYGGYVYSYAVKSIVDLNKTEGAYLNACFWGSFAVGRLGSIILATRFTPGFMLLCNLLGCLMSMILMLMLQHDHVALYFGTFFFGLFLSSITPSALSLAEQYIDVTPSITTFIVVVAAVGEMLFPVIVGNMFAILGPASFLGFGNIACLLSVFVFLALWFVGRQTPKSRANASGSFIWCHPSYGSQSSDGPDAGLVTTHVKYYTRMSESDSNIELANVQNDGSNVFMPE